MITLSAQEIEIITLSCQVAFTSLLVNALPAIYIGYILARKEFWGKALLETLIFLPLVLPPVVPGFLLLVLFSNKGLVGQYLSMIGLDFSFNWKGAVLASCIMSLPLMTQSIRLAIELVDRQLELAAMTLGASRCQVFFGITLPLAKTGILVGAVLAFCRSLGEFGATITFVGNIAGETRTLPLAIYSLMQQPDSEVQIMRLISLSIAVAFVTLGFSQWYNHKQKLRLTQ